jgi:hypothetical protein
MEHGHEQGHGRGHGHGHGHGRGFGAVALAAAIATGARAGGSDLSWNTIDGGGGESSGGVFTLHGSIGQSDAGIAMTGGAFSVLGGFWAGGGDGAAACPGDVDGSGEIGFADLIAVLAAWGPCPECPEDVDGNDEVGFGDLITLLAEWGPCD